MSTSRNSTAKICFGHELHEFFDWPISCNSCRFVSDFLCSHLCPSAAKIRIKIRKSTEEKECNVTWCDWPRLTEEDALRLLSDVYGLYGETESLPSERDQNFRITIEDGAEYVLKVANSSEDRAALDLQNRAMSHVAAKAAAVYLENLCPHLISSADGEEIATITTGDGVEHFVRLLTYLPGKPLALARPQLPRLFQSLGALLGRIDRFLSDFEHPHAVRDFHWDLQNAESIVGQYKNLLDPAGHELVDHFLQHYLEHARPRLTGLRKSVIHSDANDYNVLTRLDEDGLPIVSGVIDFGDMVYSHTVNEVAIAAAYAMLDKVNPLSVAAQVVAGYHVENPLSEDDVVVLYDLICMRLCMSVCIAAHQRQQAPDNEYLSITQAPAWALLTKLREVHPRYACCVLRAACGFEASAGSAALVDWLHTNRVRFSPLMDADLQRPETLVLDLSVGSQLLAQAKLDSRADAFERMIDDVLDAAGVAVAVGRYDEARTIYRADQFACETDELPENRTVHLGVDLFAQPGTAVYAPLDGIVVSVADNNAPLDYGPTLILRHQFDAADRGRGHFYTLYGHLGAEVLAAFQPGTGVTSGAQIATIADSAVNGGWPPHLHFQIITDLFDEQGNFPGVAAPSVRNVWTSICPDPNLILGIPDAAFPDGRRPAEEILAIRRRTLGKSLSISYRNPLHIVRGEKQFLYDVDGRAYLDVVNNVCHVGHCHPHVVRAGQGQMAVLNTNTRYLHDNIVEYAERLLAKFEDPLTVVFFVCSGSEANELALRLARTATGQNDILMLDAAYHGNTQALIDISPYKHNGRGGKGAPDWAHMITMPDPYRGIYRGTGPDAGGAYAASVKETIDGVQAQGRGVAAFIAESVLGCGGQIVLPETYLAEAYVHVRAAGGLCIADEVQVGFGRVGSRFWGYQTQGVVPDIVTMGKPIGNGHPLAAVVTTQAIADAFANGMEYFNTFGGNPVSCAIGSAVLDVIEAEDLQGNALRTGNRLMTGLSALTERFPLVGDVRGLGLFVGVELVLNPETRQPAPDHASYVADRMRDHGILISTDGPDHNVLKMKPPIVFDENDADRLVATLEKILQEDCLQV